MMKLAQVFPLASAETLWQGLLLVLGEVPAFLPVKEQ